LPQPNACYVDPDQSRSINAGREADVRCRDAGGSGKRTIRTVSSGGFRPLRTPRDSLKSLSATGQANLARHAKALCVMNDEVGASTEYEIIDHALFTPEHRRRLRVIIDVREGPASPTCYVRPDSKPFSQDITSPVPGPDASHAYWHTFRRCCGLDPTRNESGCNYHPGDPVFHRTPLLGKEARVHTGSLPAVASPAGSGRWYCRPVSGRSEGPRWVGCGPLPFDGGRFRCNHHPMDRDTPTLTL
jgi:hypothetical protein